MDTDTDPQWDSRQVSQLERPHELQDVQSHKTDVHRVSVPVAFRQTGRHHVRVTDGLHLNTTASSGYLITFCLSFFYIKTVI